MAFVVRTGAKARSSAANACLLADPSWELIDPTPDLRALFVEFNEQFFQGSLAGCEVRWSPRMTSCAGMCVYEGFGGLCSIRLSQPLLKLRPRKDLVQTLLHEMIHAYLFVMERNRDHDTHGPQFHHHMHRINKEAHTNITVYHNFHNEVQHYQTHWWRCQGPCRTKTPYFGWVRRAMNRAPGPNDNWWQQHQQDCGGVYVKVKEPEGYENGKKIAAKKSSSTAVKYSTDKRKNRSETNNNQQTATTSNPITKYFAGEGHVLGGGHTTGTAASIGGNGKAGGVNGHKRRSTNNTERPLKAKRSNIQVDSITITDESSSKGSEDIIHCPSCDIQVAHSFINAHLDLCLAQE